MPDQLATAGVPDFEMFSSLNLLASDQLLQQLQNGDSATALRQAVGIDTIVTFDKPCPGTVIASIPSPQSTVCHDPAATHPPYWFANSAVAVSGPGAAWPATKPADATVDPAAAVASAVSAKVTRWDTMGASMTIDQPVDGWVWLDRAWYPSWRVTVDGQTVPTYRAMAGTLIRVPAGSHVIEESLVPIEVGLGLLAGIAAFAIAIAWVLLGRRSPGSRTGQIGRLLDIFSGPALEPAPAIGSELPTIQGRGPEQMSSSDVVYAAMVVIGLVWMAWFWYTVGAKLLDPRVPRPLAAAALWRVGLVGVALVATLGLLYTAMGSAPARP